MTVAAYRNAPDLAHEMRAHIGRHTDKSFDWDAFPGSRGFPELERAARFCYNSFNSESYLSLLRRSEIE